MNPIVSIVMPVLNEADRLQRAGRALASLPNSEWIVVDGGSNDDSVKVAESIGANVIVSSPGRARQMNAGASLARGDYLLFLHADTTLPGDWQLWLGALESVEPDWGFFRVALQPAGKVLGLVAAAMNLRSSLTRVATGDQAMFVKHSVFEALSGFADIPLMEDVAISKRLRRRASPMIWPTPVHTSSRRWRRHGIARTIFLMWSLRLQYVLGVSPAVLYRRYYGATLEQK